MEVEKMDRRILNDYHMHSSISPDTEAAMEEMCEAACQRGLKEVVFTDHYEFYAYGITKQYFNESYLEHYFSVLEQCSRRYEGRITKKSGMEFGQSHLDLRRAKDIADRFSFDYLIGSVHKIDNIDLEKLEYTEDTVEEIARRYYESLLELSETGVFDCIGHIDLFKRHCRRHGFPDQYDLYEPVIRRVLQNVIKRGKGIEINTSGLRQASGETMPGLNVLRLYKELGGTIITAGSDAHRPVDVGAGLDEACALMRRAGFCHIAVYNQRKHSFESI